MRQGHAEASTSCDDGPPGTVSPRDSLSRPVSKLILAMAAGDRIWLRSCECGSVVGDIGLWCLVMADASPVIAISDLAAEMAEAV